MARTKAKKLPKRIENKLIRLTTQPIAQITSQPSYLKACQVLRDLQGIRKAITQHYQPIKDAINATRKTILSLEKADLAKIQQPEQAVAEAIIHFEDAPAPSEGGVVQLIDPPEGQYRLTTPKVVVDDRRAFIEAVCRGEVSLEAITPHLPTLNRLAKQHGQLFAVPGCHVERTITVVCRAE
jgi:hypothetical protein